MGKRFLFTIIALITVTSFWGQNSQRREMNKGWSDQLQSEKIAFITSELELTPQEAASFWPVYNQYWKERQIAHMAVQNNLYKISAAVEHSKHGHSDELKKLTREYIEGLAVESSIHRKYFEKLSSLLSVEKVAKLYISEDRFRMKMISRLRQGERKPAVKQ